MTVSHVSVGFTDVEDDAQIGLHYLSGPIHGIYDIVVDRAHLTWYGDDAKERLLSVLARLTAEVRALP